jgi:hypothetical protein
LKHLNHSLVTRTSLSAALTCQQVITHIQKDMNMQRPPPLMLDEIRKQDEVFFKNLLKGGQQ